jgi:(E)-benzylidenesuccinyl-CoA hydratase
MTEKATSAIQFERRGSIALITINRPHAMNALDFAANDELIDAWTRVRDDADIRAAVLTGVGDKAFCAGADLKTYTMSYAQRGAAEIRAVTDGPGFGGITRSLDVMKPIVAAINGYCISGGLELALACDVRLASPNAEFAHQDVRWGFHPCDGATQRLPWIVGLGHALQLILSGDRIGAEEAHRIGLVNRIHPRERLVDEALALAGRMASRAPLAVQAAKSVILRSLGRALEDGLRLESYSFYQLKDTEDLAEGTRAFAEKREPRFRGR